MEISKLEDILEKCWCEETTIGLEKWTAENLSWGQCVPTSLVVNDYLGGEIIWATAKLPNGEEVSHYFNRINSEEADLTRKQFPYGTIIPSGIDRKVGRDKKEHPTTRDYLLSSPRVVTRYNLLKQKVEEYLKK